MKSFSLLIAIIYVLIIAGCTQTNSKSLLGKKMYLINQGKKGGAGELELDFETNDQVKFTLTCLYYSPKVKPVTGTQLVYLKKILSAVNGTHPYTFKDNVLTIPNTNFVNLKLTYNNGFYTDSDGQLYSAESILDLSEKDKIERLRQSNPELVLDDQLPHVLVLDRL